MSLRNYVPRGSCKLFTGDSESQVRLPTRKSTKALIGWRGWRLNEWEPRDFRLQSLVVSDIWHSPVFRAEGKPSVLRPPTSTVNMREGEVHGIYAYNDIDFALRELSVWTKRDNLIVIGKLELTGTVIVHTLGFRAEVATLVKLLMSEYHGSEVIRNMENTYQCEVVTSLDELLEGEEK